MRLFVYGTLLRPATLAKFAGRNVALIPATLTGWRRVTMRGARYPTLRRSRARVAGAVATVDAATFRRLCAYEGSRYRLRLVTVRTPRAPLRCFAWIAAATTRPWP